LIAEWRDFLTGIGPLEYRLFVERPRLLRMWTSMQRSIPLRQRFCGVGQGDARPEALYICDQAEMGQNAPVLSTPYAIGLFTSVSQHCGALDKMLVLVYILYNINNTLEIIPHRGQDDFHFADGLFEYLTRRQQFSPL
jgi:hypothetical protein